MATIRQKANKLANRGLDEADDAVDSVRSAKNRANRRYGSKVDEAESTLSNAAEDLGQHLRETYDASRDQIEETTRYARKAVARNPLVALAGAFVGGLLAASILRR